MFQKYFIIIITLLGQTLIFSQWQQIYQTSSINVVFADLHFIDQNTGFVTCQDSAIYKTTNSGINWFALNSTSNHGLFNIQFTSANIGYAVGNIGFSNGQFLKTTNSGINWLVTQLPYYIFSMDFVDNNTGYLSDDNGFLHKTTNGGQNWININLNSGLYLNYVDFIDLNNGFVVASENQRLLVTSNSGINWQVKNSPAFTKVQFLNSNTGFGFVNLFQSIVYKSTDNGNSWQNIFQMDSIHIFDLNFINEHTGWLTGAKLFDNMVFFRKVFKTTNSGINWIEQYSGFIQTDSSSCLGVIQMLDSNNGYISTGYCEVVGGSPIMKGRIYKTTNGGGAPIGIEPVYSNIPENYLLHQNYPNPFNPVTKISFEIPVIGSNVSTSLTISDITGRVISVLVDEQLQPGKYEIEWNASSYSSGVYFYTLNSGNFNETRKMLMIK
jgi:photosystem II stability/assembly factor-like uncharacterized protein